MLYPGCAALLDALSVTSPGAPAMRSPVLLLHGDADPANPPAACAALANALMETAPVRRVEYAGAGYAWDRPAFAVEGPALVPRPDRKGRIRAAPLPALADLSAAQVARFFARTLHDER
jgi:dienelactone hydrolase